MSSMRREHMFDRRPVIGCEKLTYRCQQGDRSAHAAAGLLHDDEESVVAGSCRCFKRERVVDKRLERRMLCGPSGILGAGACRGV